ncbi:type I DNA topoisomerase [Deinococcus sp. KNUC1210]|uniref:type I DNA topoisomerase n=1 Tax=Deinococcus sp. KNUC1210 TaxID=2917691 RepID=UPI001EEFCA2B|nr:type I DNA topoisomerase [Deinococcus sp. KNUC1210]ULH16724.1 type I DNA topoisomerase [Deinococcus sp. KNUC1210]
MPNTLVIVESPAKARTIEKYLGKGYTVESSIGHIRDLPKSAAEIPERYKSESWARLGLNVDDDFRALYVVSPEKKGHVAKLKKLTQEADELILATDDDREGESIAWHLLQELKPKVPVRRMVFHEITKEAIQAAIASPRDIDTNLVEAQEARRALDRLYGYEVSPVLWRKVAPKLSAGRVQSVATRLLVDREWERMRFVSGSWWDIEAQVLTADGAAFPARLSELEGKRLALGRDFDPATGKLKAGSDVAMLNEAQAKDLALKLTPAALTVASAEEKPFTQRPYPPFITSTLQQEGSRKLGFGAQRTMRAAQKLYEGGYITYMRTDSPNLSAEAMNAARAQVKSMYGDAYLSPQPRIYAAKSKNAQEAHEAIRPAGNSFRTPDSLKNELDSDGWRLYDLIWKRTVASQMADARGRRMQVRLSGKASDGRAVLFNASGRAIDFPGFLRAYVEGSDDPNAALEDREVILPPLTQGQAVTGKTMTPGGHETQPPARYTEASLVQSLESQGIGRPSTYASIIGTIQDRGYAAKKGSALIPTWTAFATSALLEHHFGKLVDYDFTARMEEDLDDIAGGRQQRVPYLRAFYSGEGGGMGIHPLIEAQMPAIDARAVATIEVPKLIGSGIEVRVGRYGPYLSQGEVKANIPAELAPDELTLEKALDLMSRPSGDHPLGDDPETGLPVIAKAGRFGPYVQLGDTNPPARTASLFPTDDLNDLTLERALKLLTLPRLVGTSEGEEVWALNGKFGPYLKRGSDSRSITAHEQLFTVTIPEAEEAFRQPRFRGRGSAVAGPLKVFEYADRAAIQLKSGRFGPYLTDGTRNATLRKGEEGAELTLEDARSILEERGKEPQKKPGKAKATGAKKPTAKAKGTTSSRSKAKKPVAAAEAGGMAIHAPLKKTVKAPAKKTAPRKATKATAKPAAKAPAKTALAWADLKSHLGVLSEQERALVVATREQGRKVEDVAPDLGLDVKKAKGMALQASKKLNQAARAG